MKSALQQEGRGPKTFLWLTVEGLSGSALGGRRVPQKCDYWDFQSFYNACEMPLAASILSEGFLCSLDVCALWMPLDLSNINIFWQGESMSKSKPVARRPSPGCNPTKTTQLQPIHYIFAFSHPAIRGPQEGT